MTTLNLQGLYRKTLDGDREAAAALEAATQAPRSPQHELAILLCGAPSSDAWRQACDLITALPHGTAAAFLPAARRWPARIRRGLCTFSLGNHQATNSGDMAEPLAALLRTGQRCPGLSMLGWAVVSIAYPEHTPRDQPSPAPLAPFLDDLSMTEFQETMRPVVYACARHLDPGFTALNRVSHRSSDRFWNNFSETVRVGKKQQGMTWQWEEVEHCVDESARGQWMTHGLAQDTNVTVERYQRKGRAYKLYARGPAPAILDVVEMFGAVCRAEETLTAQDILKMLPP